MYHKDYFQIPGEYTEGGGGGGGGNSVDLTPYALKAEAATDHNHDTQYAAKVHTHAGYVTPSELKTTLTLYSLDNHDHDNRYSQLPHNHDGRYSLANHRHDGIYTKPADLTNALVPYAKLTDIPGKYRDVVHLPNTDTIYMIPAHMDKLLIWHGTGPCYFWLYEPTNPRAGDPQSVWDAFFGPASFDKWEVEIFNKHAYELTIYPPPYQAGSSGVMWPSSQVTVPMYGWVRIKMYLRNVGPDQNNPQQYAEWLVTFSNEPLPPIAKSSKTVVV